MSLENLIKAQKLRHVALHEKIEALEGHPSVDDLELRALKREKLLLKDEIKALQARDTAA